MSDQVVATIRKNARDEIRVGLQEWKGVQLVSVRVWFKAEDGKMRPGKDGLNFRLDILSDVAEALTTALMRARESGLLK